MSEVSSTIEKIQEAPPAYDVEAFLHGYKNRSQFISIVDAFNDVEMSAALRSAFYEVALEKDLEKQKALLDSFYDQYGERLAANGIEKLGSIDIERVSPPAVSGEQNVTETESSKINGGELNIMPRERFIAEVPAKPELGDKTKQNIQEIEMKENGDLDDAQELDTRVTKLQNEIEGVLNGPANDNIFSVEGLREETKSMSDEEVRGLIRIAIPNISEDAVEWFFRQIRPEAA